MTVDSRNSVMLKDIKRNRYLGFKGGIDMKFAILLFLALLPAVTTAGTYRESRSLELPAAGIRILSVRCGAGGLSLIGIEGTDSIKVLAEIETEGADKEEFQHLADKSIQLDLRREYDRALLLSDVLSLPLVNFETRVHLNIQ